MRVTVYVTDTEIEPRYSESDSIGFRYDADRFPPGKSHAPGARVGKLEGRGRGAAANLLVAGCGFLIACGANGGIMNHSIGKHLGWAAVAVCGLGPRRRPSNPIVCSPMASCCNKGCRFRLGLGQRRREGDGESRGPDRSTTAQNGQWEVRLKPLPAGWAVHTDDQRREHRHDQRRAPSARCGFAAGSRTWRSVCPGRRTAPRPLPRPRIPCPSSLSLPHGHADTPAREVAVKWQECDPKTVPGFSAVGYFFGLVPLEP